MRYGVLSTDLKYIVAIPVFFWLVPLLLNIRLAGIQIFFIAGPGSLICTYAFCYWRAGKRPLWLQHRLRSLLRNPVERGSLPIDRLVKPLYSWLK
jgi:hypothetical protein